MDDLHDPLHYLTDPRIFAVGRLPAVSDHAVYASEAEATLLKSSLMMNLDGRWKFAYAKTPDTRPTGFAAPDYDCAAWGEIDVPGHIQLQGYGAPQYVNTQYPWDGHEALRPPQIPTRENSVGCYVRFFRLPDNFHDQRVTLVLHGAETACFVWLNGTLLGYAEDSFTPSRFDLTRALCEGENKLAVEVYRYSSASWIEDQDFWRFSGLFRSVELHASPRAHLEDVFARAVPDENLTVGVYTVDVQLTLHAEPVTLRADLLAVNGIIVDSVTMPAREQLTFTRTVSAPLLWSAEQPNLYTLRMTLSGADGHTIEVAQTEVGFRRFEIKDGVMLLNGRRILLHGVNRHEFGCNAGRVLTHEQMLWDIRTLKRNNINAVRTSHYPNDSFWYRLCDRYGIYVIDEANLESHGSWQKMGKIDAAWAVPDGHAEWREACIDRARSMLERDKNHPSVLLWSCGNESYGGLNILAMAEFFRTRDPGRPVHYEGLFNDRRYPATSDVESRMYPPAEEVAAWLEREKGKPFLLCEYSHAMGNSCGGLAEYLALEERYPQYQGGFIWDYIDQALEATLPGGMRGLAYGGDFGDQPTDRNFCGDGLVFADRTESPKMQEVKFLYQSVRITPDAQGVTLCNRNLFDDLRGYRLCWRVTRDGEPFAEGALDDVNTPAGEHRTFALPLPPLRAAGEYALLCELCWKTAPLWADTVYPQMHGQKVIAVIPQATAAEPVQPCTLSQGDVNAGAYGDGMELLFSYAEGGPVSIRRDGIAPVLNYAPRPSLYRAMLDNDRGNGFAQATALWMAFTELATPRCEKIRADGGRLCVDYCHTLPPLTDAYFETRYEVTAPGCIRVTASLSGGAGLPDLPAFGLCLRLPRALSHARYYGLGPAENGVDRAAGAVLGIYETTADRNLTPYLKPQGCGNRMGVRWLELTDGQQRGLRVRMDGRPLEVSVLPHSQAELASALHREALPAPAYTFLDVAMARYGVGGDNSWGAPVLPHYRLHADQPLRFSFWLELL
jgi:beta-galactosidase